MYRLQLEVKLISTGSSCAFPERDTPLLKTTSRAVRCKYRLRANGLAKQVLAIGCRAYGEQYGLTPGRKSFWRHSMALVTTGPPTALIS